MFRPQEKNLFTPPDVYRALGLSSFVALDLETTGLNASSDDIIEIGAARVKNGRVTQTFQRLVGIQRDLPLQISRLTGIQSADLAEQPPLMDILPEFLSWLAGEPILGHNIAFDLRFLNAYLSAQPTLFQDGQPLGRLRNPRVDTLVLARAVLPRLKDHRLETLVDFFDIDMTAAHRALEDVFAEIQLFDRLLPLLLTQPQSVLERWAQIVAPLSGGTAHLFQRAALIAPEHAPAVQRLAASLRLKITPTSNNIIGENFVRPAPEEGKNLLDEEAVAGIFSENGLLNAGRSDFEKRDQQIEMSGAVARAFNEEAFLLVEAGTGTGKSLAYLVPAILWAQRHPFENGRVVVSTNTKNLQEQIFAKDLPFLFQHLPEPFRAVLLKGRNNYVCLERWQKFLADLPEAILTEEERFELLPIVAWLEETFSGDIEENTAFHPQFYPELWGQIQADSHFCSGQKCPFYQQCFVMRARRAARQADLVVVNHSLLLSDLAANRSVLSEYTRLILDEAHNLEAAATKYLSSELSMWTVQGFLHQLYRFVGKEIGLLPRLRDSVYFSHLTEAGKNRFLNILFALIQETGETEKISRHFFGRLSEKAWEVNLAQKTAQTAKIRYRNWEEVFATLTPLVEEFTEALDSLKRGLTRLSDALATVSEEELAERESFVALVEGARTQVEEILTTLKELVETSIPNFVYWCEPPVTEKKLDARLLASPMNVSSVLKNRLYDALDTAVFTSATLTVGGDFGYFKSRVGLHFVDPDRLLERVYGSPFHYDEQVLLGVPGFLPDPRERNFVTAMSHLLREVILKTKRGTLVLFTSYEMLLKTYEMLKIDLAAEGILTLAQGKDGSRNTLVRIFEGEGNAVLLGTNSFWEGVDIPGEPLEILVLTKLPFEVPAEPVIQAWMEEIEKRGGNSFYQLSVPMAVLKFRQGFGRLIRSGSDRGVVLILDNRVVRFQYGRIFLESLPVEAQIFESQEELIREMENWFA